MTAGGSTLPIGRRDPGQGIVLVYVLVVLAVASAIVVAMVGQSDRAIDRTRMFADAAQAQALLDAAETSAVAALGRDPRGVDHQGEDWAKLAQGDLAIAGGRFQMRIADAQGLYNLTNLVSGGVLAQDRVRAIARSLDLGPATATRIIAAFASDPPPQQLGDLSPVVGVADLKALAAMATVLPDPCDVNINAAPTEVLAVLLGNPVQARKLVLRRQQAGYLTPVDLPAMGVILPPGIGFRSDAFRVEVRVQVGDALRTTSSLIRRGAADHSAASVVSRQDIAPDDATPPPGS